MRIKFISMLAGAVMLSAALNFAHAATPPLQNALADGTAAPFVRLAGGEVETLRQAYITLSVADRDYKGHRVRAMKAIEAACKLLGTDIFGRRPRARTAAHFRCPASRGPGHDSTGAQLHCRPAAGGQASGRRNRATHHRALD